MYSALDALVVDVVLRFAMRFGFAVAHMESLVALLSPGPLTLHFFVCHLHSPFVIEKIMLMMCDKAR